MSVSRELEQIFSYGTLQNDTVQRATFGRRLAGEIDSLPLYRRVKLDSQRSNAVVSGSEPRLVNALFTGLDADCVAGTRYAVTRDELEQADIHEQAASYQRVRVQLKSGAQAWVYVRAALTSVA